MTVFTDLYASVYIVLAQVGPNHLFTTKNGAKIP